MKRIISIIITAALVFSLCLTSAYATVRPVTAVKSDIAAGLLKYLKIMEITDENSEITRADFACYVARTLGVNEYSKPAQMYFKDIPTTHWAANCINFLVGLDAIHADGVSEFRPNDVITTNEAVKILVTVLGYGVYADVNGGYPVGHLMVSNTIGLQSNTSRGELVTSKDAAIMIANALTAKMYVAVSYGGMINEYEQREDVTILSKYHDIYRIEGIVDATEYTSLTSATGVGAGRISIDGVIYECEGNNFPYIANEVVAYYRQAEDDNIGEIILIANDNDSDEIIVINDENFKGFNQDYVLEYYEDGATKTTKINIPKSASFIYNGVYANTDIVEKMNIDAGEIKVIVDETGNYSTVVINSYEIFAVSYADSANGYVYPYGTTKKIDLLGENGDVFIFDNEGNELTASSIVKNNVLTVYRSGDFETDTYIVTYVYVSRETAKGTIASVSTAGDYAEYTIGDDVYLSSIAYYNANKTDFEVGTEVTFYLDIRGKIAYHELGTVNAFEYGYLIDANYDNDMDGTLIFKLLNTDNEFAYYKAAPKMTIDGIRKNNYSEARDALGSITIQAPSESNPGALEPKVVVKPQLIRFILNDKEQITDIDLSKEKDTESNGYEPDDTLTRTHYGRHGQNGNRFDYISVGILGEKIVFNDSTILFIVPEDNDVQSEPLNKFKISNLRTRVEWTSKDIEAYTSNTNSSVSEVVVFKESYSTQPLPKNHLMVEKIIKVINDEGMEVEHVIGWRDGVQVEYDVTDDEFDGKAVSLINMGVDEGDLVLLALDTSNVIVGCRIAYDASAKSPGKYFSMNYTENGEDNGFYKAFDYYDEQSLRFGYVDTLLGGVASMSYTLGGEVKEMYPVPTVAATVYDESNKNNPIYKGGIGDIADYQSVDNDCSRIIVYASYAQWKSYYIYK